MIYFRIVLNNLFRIMIIYYLLLMKIIYGKYTNYIKHGYNKFYFHINTFIFSDLKILFG